MKTGTNIRRGSVQENAAINNHSGYEQLPALAPTASATKSQELPYSCHKIHIYSDSDIYFVWALVPESTTDKIDTAKDLIIPAGTLIVLNLPWGMFGGIRSLQGESLHFQCRRVLTGTADVRVARG